MAVVMLLMVATATWQALRAVVPVAALVVGFALATGWFGWLSADAFRAADRRGGLHFAGHAMMFGAMTWHLAAMAVMAARMAAMGGMDHGEGGMSHADMGGIAQARQPGGVLWVFALVGVPFMTYLLVASIAAIVDLLRPRAAVNDACPCGEGCTCGPECSCGTAHVGAEAPERQLLAVGAAGVASTPAIATALEAHSCHEVRPVGSRTYRLAALSDFAMNFGMFWMSTGLMIAILPFFALFAF